MKKWLLLALLFSLNAQAETFFCAAEAGTYVESTEQSSIESGVYDDIAALKLLISNESGGWQVKQLGENHAMFTCETKYLCTGPPSEQPLFGGFFSRTQNGMFTIVFFESSNNIKTTRTVTAKGRCSKL